ncbi:cytochrome c biogenesis CcdA family protein [Priestia megaterium]|uniref:cytochrome c biogenesis CcdA family protein n=1 Tax=Priestia megaterium TaxID=1404 RepID=UPI000BFD6877|nr:cytochrome c biogenesis protein CcdA [Priestia megaterium]MBW0934208.1 cytochrome c biogenesis protein CcdA [Priestia megaterium]PGX80592.1 cytochrome C biogenesis protein CcdA [Priestia megaterium]
MNNINIFLSFGAGFLSFISPCCLPLYPAFLSYITGISVQDLKQENKFLNYQSILHTIFFILGFSIIFLVLGLSTTMIGMFFEQYEDLMRELGAVLIMFFGLVTAGIFQPKFLMKNKKFTFANRPSGYIGSILIGFGYATGWTPCVGPILGAVTSLGIYTGEGLIYMLAYILGFSIPFFIMSFFIGKTNWIKRYSHRMMITSGYVMILMGIVLYFDGMTKITSYLTTYIFNGFQGF